MSLTKTNASSSTKNPAIAVLEWDAMEGNFKYYDTVAKERKYLTDSEFSFVVLDQLSNVSGWVKDVGGCRATETHNLTANPIRVQSWKDGKPTLIKEGMYKDIKESLKSMGIKYRKIVYAMTVASDDFGAGEIIKLDLGGCAMSEWIEADVKDGKQVSLGQAEEVQLNKMVSYNKPSFGVTTPETDILSEAEAADKELQAYFDGKKAVVAMPKQDDLDVSEEYEDDVPF